MKRIALVAGLVLLVINIMAGPSAYAQGMVNINTASKRRLEKLPGIGEDMAKLIIAYRRENGSFQNVSELKEVFGIGERRLEALKQMVTVGGPAEKSL